MGVLKHYGDYIVSGELADRTTIHGSGTIDIQTDATGHVVAVWFRCLNLPFTVSEAGPGREEPIQPETQITAIEYVDKQ